jgi:prolyl oligopeptidase
MVLGKYSVENNLTLYYAPKADLKSAHIAWQALSTPTDEVRAFWLSGDDIFFLSTKGNPKFKIVKTDLRHPDLAKATTVVEGKDDWKISDAEIVQTKDYLIVTKSKNDLITRVLAYDMRTGKTSDIDVPLKGNLHPLGISQDEDEIVLSNTGWSVPTDLYSYDVTNRQLSNGVFHMAPGYTGLENIVAEEVEVPSHDGAMVPVSIIYDKTKLKKDGSNTCFMMGYGAYGLSPYLPGFNSQFMPLIGRGVVIAISHVRGGGEKGNEWYLAGKKATKPNTWKDLNASAEYLIKNRYTSSEKLGITGGSAGGILIGRAITERPDLYRVAIPKVGDLNALRGEFTPNGPVNTPEFGTVKDEGEFKALLEMDAYQHIRKGTKYPAQLITTGFNDPRVDSFIPAKFAARMQAENGSDRPVFLYVDYAAGHFGGSTVDERFKQTSREYAFLLWQTGDNEFQPSK